MIFFLHLYLLYNLTSLTEHVDAMVEDCFYLISSNVCELMCMRNNLSNHNLWSLLKQKLGFYTVGPSSHICQ